MDKEKKRKRNLVLIGIAIPISVFALYTFIFTIAISSVPLKKGEEKMRKYLNLMSWKTKLKCIGVVLLAMVSSVLASIWPVRLGAIYTIAIP